MESLDDFVQPAGLLSADGNLLACNRVWRRQLDAGVGAALLDMAPQPDRYLLRARWCVARSSEGGEPFACRLTSISGQPFQCVVHIARRPCRIGAEEGYLITLADVRWPCEASEHERHEARARQRLLDASVDCIKLIDVQGRLRMMNRAGCLALGLPPGEREFGMRWLDLLPADVRSRGRHALSRAAHGHASRFPGLSQLAGKPDQHWDNILSPLPGTDGRIEGILCMSRNVSAQREAERRLRIASDIDDLTGLLNRRAFKRGLKRLLSRAREDRPVGLLMMDLDHFKHVNDTLGHAAGDHLLRTLGRRLRAMAPDDALVGRLGGDEFALALPLSAGRQLQRLAGQILERVRSPLSHAGKAIQAGASIGSASAPTDANDLSGLLRCADVAMHALKQGRRGGWRAFECGLLASTQQAEAQQRRAGDALRQGVISVAYQPRVRLCDGSLLGMEALLRWRDQSGALRLAGDIADAFRDYALATHLADAVHDVVLADLARWRALGLAVLPVSINAATVEFLRDDFAERLLQRLERHGVPAQWLALEVTEDALVERGSDYVMRALTCLRAAGMTVMLDHYGSGQTSILHLRDRPVDGVKLSSDYVRRAPDDAPAQAIVQALAMLAPKLGLDVVAGGVESDRQLQLLVQAGIGAGQGFLFGQDFDADATAKHLAAAC